MAKRLKAVFLCCLVVGSMLCGCQGGRSTGEDEQTVHGSDSESGTLSVCAGERYRFALQQILSHINLSGNGLTLIWTDDMETADVIITDNLESEKLGEYQVIDTEKLGLQGIGQLTVQDERGTVGLPLFLRLDGFWYDELLYKQQEAVVPQSLDTWQKSTLTERYPAVCDQEDMETVFWGVIAPLYLSNGGTEEELSNGTLQEQFLLPALKQLEALVTDGFLQLSSDARQSFITTQASYWLAGVDRVAESYHYMSNLSSWWPSVSLLFPATERAVCVVRSEVLAVHNTVDPELAERFLKLFFDQQTAADLSDYVRMPMACQMLYTPGVVPALPQICYTVLSSPVVDVAYVACGWENDRQEQVYSSLLSLMQEQIDAIQAAKLLTQ